MTTGTNNLRTADLTPKQLAWLAANRVEVETGKSSGVYAMFTLWIEGAPGCGYRLLWDRRTRFSAEGWSVDYSDDGFQRVAVCQQAGMSLAGALKLALYRRAGSEAYRRRAAA